MLSKKLPKINFSTIAEGKGEEFIGETTDKASRMIKGDTHSPSHTHTHTYRHWQIHTEHRHKMRTTFNKGGHCVRTRERDRERESSSSVRGVNAQKCVERERPPHATQSE